MSVGVGFGLERVAGGDLGHVVSSVVGHLDLGNAEAAVAEAGKISHDVGLGRELPVIVQVLA